MGASDVGCAAVATLPSAFFGERYSLGARCRWIPDFSLRLGKALSKKECARRDRLPQEDSDLESCRNGMRSGPHGVCHSLSAAEGIIENQFHAARYTYLVEDPKQVVSYGVLAHPLRTAVFTFPQCSRFLTHSSSRSSRANGRAYFYNSEREEPDSMNDCIENSRELATKKSPKIYWGDIP